MNWADDETESDSMQACRPAILAASQGCCIFSFMNTQRQLCIFALRRSFRRVKIAIARQLGASGSHASRFHTGCAVYFNAPPSKEGSSEVGDIRLIWIRMPAAGRVSMVRVLYTYFPTIVCQILGIGKAQE